MTLVSSAYIMGSDKVFIVGGRSFILQKARALELILGELHVLRFLVSEKIHCVTR
jgi:hypothetical protein